MLKKEVVKERLHTRQKEMEVVEPSFFGSHGKQKKYSRPSNNISIIGFFKKFVIA